MRNTLKISFLAFFSCIFINASAQKINGNDTGDEFNVFVPNAFTPNSDGVNDIFKPVISGQPIDTYELVILDRTGGQAFYSTDPSEVWDGSSRTSSYATSPAIYVYFLKVKSTESLETLAFTGHITMVR